MPSHPNFLNIHLNILPSMPGSPKWSLSLMFPHQNPVYASPLPHTCYMSAHLILHDFITWKYRVRSRSLSSLCSFLHFPITSSLLGPNILLSTLFSNTLSLRCFLNVSNQVSHVYTITGKVIVL
jgi:hypothetical protein